MWHQRVKHSVWMKLGCIETALPLFGVAQATFKRGIGVVDRNTDIVIEGYPRCGNTFAVVAFSLAQEWDPKIAHHVHGTAQISYAVKRNIPTIVLSRNPVDAVTSLLVRQPYLLPEEGFSHYVRFYRDLIPYRQFFILGGFDEVTTDFGRTIQRVNQKFGTEFQLFEHIPENVSKCYQVIDVMDQKDNQKSGVTESTVARPSATRTERKAMIQRQIFMAGGKLQRLVDEAVELYHELNGYIESPTNINALEHAAE